MEVVAPPKARVPERARSPRRWYGTWFPAGMPSEKTRREFLSLSTTGAVLTVLSGCAKAAERPAAAPKATPHPSPLGRVPRRLLGRTGEEVSILGIGGSHLALVRDDDDALRIVHEAIDAGVTFFDNAWEYHDGRSEEILGRALEGRRHEVFLMTKVCTHGRKADVAMQQLEQSLQRLRTDRLDLWQVHECIYDNDPERHFATDGVITALDRAKRDGKVRFAGFTGHKSPLIHLKMLSYGYPFDTVQMPINVFDAQFRSFETSVLPEARRRNMGIIGMKSLNGTGAAVRSGVLTAEEGLRYAMSAGVSTTVSGIDSLDILRQNLAVARDFQPMKAEEMEALRRRVAPEAADGKFELYKTSLHFDGETGRHEHGFPGQHELPL